MGTLRATSRVLAIRLLLTGRLQVFRKFKTAVMQIQRQPNPFFERHLFEMTILRCHLGTGCLTLTHM